MNGDATGKAIDQGVNSTIKNAEMSNGIHESNYHAVRSCSEFPSRIILRCHMRLRDPVSEKTTHLSSIKTGAVGKLFKADGVISSIGKKVGGPFASDGAIGKNFNSDGTIGETVHENIRKEYEFK
jgi:hypothetical protein